MGGFPSNGDFVSREMREKALLLGTLRMSDHTYLVLYASLLQVFQPESDAIKVLPVSGSLAISEIVYEQSNQ